MSVATTNRTTTLNMADTTLEYDFTFTALESAPSDIKVKTVLESTGAETDLTYSSEYTVSVNTGGVGGTVTLDATVTQGSSYNIVIYRDTTRKQESDYANYNQFPADTLESDLDRAIMVVQELGDDIGRQPQLPISSTISSLSMEDGEPDKVLGWNSLGTDIVNQTGMTDSIEQCSSHATTALTHTTTASSHATTAVTQATTATTQATYASSHATTAESYSTSALQEVVEDTTPVLGGDLDMNDNDIKSTSGDIILQDDNSGGIHSTPNQSGCRVYLSGGDQTIPDTTATKITLNAENYDKQNEFDSTSNYRFTATKAGRYLVMAVIWYNSGDDQDFGALRIYKNGANWLEVKQRMSGVDDFTVFIYDILDLSAGDYIELYAWQDTTGAKDIYDGSDFTFMSISKIQ